MSTRGAFGFRSNRKDKLSYNHWDSYPTGMGVEVAEFIKGSTDKELKDTARSILLIDQEKAPTKAQQKAVRDFEKKHDIVVSDIGVSTQSLDEWYCLLRQAQGNLDMYKLGLEYMLDGTSFMNDSLFCEWAYVINTDTNNLEIYKGFNKDPKAKGRYASQGGNDHNEYYGVALAKEIPFKDIRKADIEELMSTIEKEAYPEEEEEEA